MKRFRNLIYLFTVCLTMTTLVAGCGESGKQPPPGPAAKQEAPATQAGATTATTPGASGAVKQQSCYDIGYKTGRCAAKSMSNLPCEPGEDIPMPAECKGKPETEKGLTEGRKSVY
ncbi:MAG: hypothetical protein M0Q01_13935 [Syntrophales bacterium]|nr:hypothetical protein [Syntrophales bacterium]